MVALLLEGVQESWLTPSTIANGGVALVLLAVGVLFFKYLMGRDAQLQAMNQSFLSAINETRRQCDATTKEMSERFIEETRQLTERSLDSSLRVEKSIDALVNELRANSKRRPT